MPVEKDKSPRKRRPGDAEQVAAWMATQNHPLKAGIGLLRDIIRFADPRIEERIKWNAPSYHVDNTDIVTFGPRRGDRILLVFHHPAIVQVSSELLEGDFKDRRLAWFDSAEQIVSKRLELIRIIQAILPDIDPPGNPGQF